MSPHFGLIDESKMSREEALLMRAKLHWRSGVRRMGEEKVAAGFATLYDALLSSMKWYILSRLRDKLGKDVLVNIENEQFVVSLLREESILDDSFDLELIEQIVDKALSGEDVTGLQDKAVENLELFLTKLGVLPFDESKLPPEDPSTF